MKNGFKAFLETKGITEEEFLKKDAEAMAALYNEYNEKVRKELSDAIEAKASKEDIDAMKAHLTESINKQMLSLNEALKEQGIAIRKLLTERKSGGKHTENLKEQLLGLKDKLDAIKNNDSKESLKFVVKTVGTMTSSNISGGNVPVEDRIEGLNLIASRAVRLLDLFERRATESNIVSWVYQASREGAADQTSEGSTKNQVDFDLVVASQTVRKSTDYIKVSTEMINDIAWMEGEIKGELLGLLMRHVESQAYSGDGTGQNLTGVKTVATAFAPGTFAAGSANQVDNANVVDVLAVALNQIKLANQVMLRPAILLNPTTVTALKTKKVSSTDKRYIERLAEVAGQLRLDGVPIIESTLVAEDEYLVGDWSKAILVEKEGVYMEIGLDGNDLTKNLRTVIAEWRGLVLVKNNDRTAFVTGTISTDITAITAI